MLAGFNNYCTHHKYCQWCLPNMWMIWSNLVSEWILKALFVIVQCPSLRIGFSLQILHCCFAQHKAHNLLNCHPASYQAMLQRELYYSEGYGLTMLVLLAEYKLKTKILKNNFKYKHVKKEKEGCRKKILGRYHLKIQCLTKDLSGCNKQDLRAGLQFVAWIVLNTTFLEHNYMSDTS